MLEDCWVAINFGGISADYQVRFCCVSEMYSLYDGLRSLIAISEDIFEEG